MLIENHKVPDKDIADEGAYEDYELKEACETLARAEEIKADSKLMKALQPLLEKRSKAYLSLSEMRQKSAEMSSKEMKTKRL